MMTASLDHAVACVRRFTRFYTRRMGVLEEALLGSAFTLPEARIVYEIAVRDRTTASDLVADLGLDPGYVSRLIKSLEERGFITRRPSETDARQYLLDLTPLGRREFSQINRKSDEEVQKLLEPLGASDRARLVAALSTAEALLAQERPEPQCTFRDLCPGDIGWVIHRHGALYAAEYGWDVTFEALVAKVCAEFVETFDPARERAWIAELDGRIVGSIFLVKKTDEIAKLRLLYVEPDARGHGIGRRLVEDCIAHARAVGYRRMTLWTNDVLTAARKIYQAAGFKLVHSEPHHSFGKDLVGETWELGL
jgi:DNA-binding MarR family transcriptional regulator/N-acetylglutamate synthase-like GNAT family acetyltransferase